MRAARRGRPAKIDPNRKRVSIDQAVEMSNQFWAQFGKKGYSKRYIYNLISEGKLERHHFGKFVLLFEDEVRERFCG